NKITSKEVITINNKPVNEIVTFIDEVFPSENYVAEDKNNSNYMKFKSVLLKSGINCSDSVVLQIEDIDKKENMRVEFINEFVNDYESSKTSIVNLDDDIIYIQLSRCDVNETLDYIIDKLNDEIKKGKINKVIIDVRNNPGGDSRACMYILDALNMQVDRYGMTVRFSQLAKESRGYLRSSGKTNNKPKNFAKKNEDIDLYVITNENTFSSAQMLAVWVKDGDLGKVVGEPSSNKPSCYGDILYYSLNNSNITGQISHKKWVRPDISKDKDEVLEMDIPVEYGVDPIEVIIND
ncbi:MAG: S41 family peptidase, partial [Peptostreptococcaceae bacterium]